MLLDHAPATTRAPTLADPPPVRASMYPRPAEHPVFLDPAGRRARRVKLASSAIAVMTALWVVGLVGGPLGFLSLPPVPQLASAVPATMPLAGVPPLRPFGTGPATAAPLGLVASVLDLEPESRDANRASGHGPHRRPQLT